MQLIGHTLPVVAGRFKMKATVKPLEADRRRVRLLLPGHKTIAAKRAVVRRCIQTGRAYRWRVR